MRTGARIIRRSIYCENQSVIFMLETRHYMIEKYVRILHSEHLFHEHIYLRYVLLRCHSVVHNTSPRKSTLDVSIGINETI